MMEEKFDLIWKNICMKINLCSKWKDEYKFILVQEFDSILLMYFFGH